MYIRVVIVTFDVYKSVKVQLQIEFPFEKDMLGAMKQQCRMKTSNLTEWVRRTVTGPNTIHGAETVSYQTHRKSRGDSMGLTIRLRQSENWTF